jgi:hypothetical protein
MASESIRSNGVGPRDYRTFIAIGPFDELGPGQTVEVNFALVVTPRDDFTHVERAATAYHGLWFDLDGDPNTGIDGKEHQENWYLPDDVPVPVTITRFNARALDAQSVHVAWDVFADEAILGFALHRTNDGVTRTVTPGLLPAQSREFVDTGLEAGGRYRYTLTAQTVAGETFASQAADVVVPNFAIALGQNSPNPFQQETTIDVSLPERAEIDVSVFDVAGRRVATVTRGERAAGDHRLTWNGTNDAGKRVGAGVYFYRLKAGNETLTRKLIVVR